MKFENFLSVFFIIFFNLFLSGFALAEKGEVEKTSGPILIARISSSINPGTDDYLRSALTQAHERNASLFVLYLNTPGGLVTSMQSMVEAMLDSKVPSLVYVSPSGGGAISAGVFITMAGNIAVMAPGTTIGAAHPVASGGEDVEGDMRKKIENFTASLIKAIAEQRKRNAKWAEDAVRNSVAITDKEALNEKVIDLVATDLDEILEKIEGRVVEVKGKELKLFGLKNAQKLEYEMTFKQQIVNFLSDPNVAMIIGMLAMVGLGMEFYNPGLIVPGIVGVVCLVLSLTAAQVLPINMGGLALLILSAIFFIVEIKMPSFGIWGIAAIICLVVGSIYFIDMDFVWSSSGFRVNPSLVGSVSFFSGSLVLMMSYLYLRTSSLQVKTGSEGMINKVGVVKSIAEDGTLRVMVSGELWKAKLEDVNATVLSGDRVKVVEFGDALTLGVVKV